MTLAFLAAMNVGELCTRSVVVAAPELPVLEAARRMRDHHVGNLVVVQNGSDGDEPVGVLTDRDLVLEVMAHDIEHADTLQVAQVMTCELVTAREDEDASEVLDKMRTHGVRRVPVVDDHGALAGIITYDDLLEWFVEELGGLVAVVGSQPKAEAERIAKEALPGEHDPR